MDEKCTHVTSNDKLATKCLTFWLIRQGIEASVIRFNGTNPLIFYSLLSVVEISQFSITARFLMKRSSCIFLHDSFNVGVRHISPNMILRTIFDL